MSTTLFVPLMNTSKSMWLHSRKYLSLASSAIKHFLCFIRLLSQWWTKRSNSRGKKMKGVFTLRPCEASTVRLVRGWFSDTIQNVDRIISRDGTGEEKRPINHAPWWQVFRVSPSKQKCNLQKCNFSYYSNQYDYYSYCPTTPPPTNF